MDAFIYVRLCIHIRVNHRPGSTQSVPSRVSPLMIVLFFQSGIDAQETTTMARPSTHPPAGQPSTIRCIPRVKGQSSQYI